MANKLQHHPKVPKLKKSKGYVWCRDNAPYIALGAVLIAIVALALFTGVYWIGQNPTPFLLLFVALFIAIYSAWGETKRLTKRQLDNLPTYPSHFMDESKLDTARRNIKASSMQLFTKKSAGGITIALIIVNLVTIVLSAIAYGSTSPRYGSYRQATADFGLVSGESYPLVVGNVSTSTYGSGSFSKISLIPTGTLTLEFSQDNNHYLLVIPTDKINFASGDGKPSVAITLTDISYGSSDFWDQAMSSTWGLSNLSFGAVSWFTNSTPHLTEAGKTAGLPKVVQEGLTQTGAHVVITMSDQQRHELFGVK